MLGPGHSSLERSLSISTSMMCYEDDILAGVVKLRLRMYGRGKQVGILDTYKN